MGFLDSIFGKKKAKPAPVKIEEYKVPAKPLVQIAEEPKPAPIPVSGIVEQAKSTLPIIPIKDLRLSAKGTECIKHDEAFRKKPYLDSKNVPTIGFGTTYYPDGRRVTLQDPFCTMEQALEWLAFHVENRCRAPMAKLIKVGMNQNQYDALTSFVYNAGEGGFATSTMLKLINQGKMKEAANEFPKWNKSGGEVIQGLINRRKREQALFMSDV